MQISKLIELSRKPPLFERSPGPFWDDPYISAQMLKAHLNPDIEAASRPPAVIDASVKWLNEKVIPCKQARVLDLGCGPGLYTSRLARLGYQVTGIDYSRRSIEYAEEYARQNKLKVDYRYQNYLTMDFDAEFDVVLLIFCDLGALTNAERDILLQKVYRALKPGGVFVFDVFTDKNRGKDAVGRTWEVTKSGFWNAKPYLALTETFLYEEEDTFLDQTLVITEDGEISIYRIYDHFYTKDTIAGVLNRFGFRGHKFYSDVTGREYNGTSATLAVVTRK